MQNVFKGISKQKLDHRSLIKLAYVTLTSDHFKQRNVEEWNRFDQGVFDNAINEWRKRLRACIRANGGHFEHQF